MPPIFVAARSELPFFERKIIIPAVNRSPLGEKVTELVSFNLFSSACVILGFCRWFCAVAAR
jgi:hypothetical protein